MSTSDWVDVGGLMDSFDHGTWNLGHGQFVLRVGALPELSVKDLSVDFTPVARTPKVVGTFEAPNDAYGLQVQRSIHYALYSCTMRYAHALCVRTAAGVRCQHEGDHAHPTSGAWIDVDTRCGADVDTSTVYTIADTSTVHTTADTSTVHTTAHQYYSILQYTDR
jgi:hypothetical protein